MTDLIYQYQLWRGQFEDIVIWNIGKIQKFRKKSNSKNTVI